MLSALIRKGIAKARVITRARVLLLASEGRKDREIYRSLLISYSTPHDVRKNYARGGLNRALYDAPRPGQARKLTGKQEAEVIAIACTDAPKGYVRWTLDLLTEEVTNKLGVSIGRTAIWHILLRNNLKPHRKKNVVYSHSNS
ncbi:hypothetical protein A3C26_00555 [Candidatus Daviesbacteria bacterium RIFCSPHIGHO2_02_FULL_39_12]|uniref:Winged helix-turn helix domain-containing protein n=1 Tax=Candidatus Daviesbacteria bacterium RIFCSPHIGHO2_02_FULL_39_12 TaxID=1797770 RepID=A0A1F5JCX2_9BACT|nr:MAG: hypothetical protein A3C26_00555 [Candidatus Daviesbacteria bacterium RIFCSPHIGHO2_02_FULL_39_12]